MARRVLTSLHGNEIGLGDDRELLIRSGIIRTVDGSSVSFPDGIDGDTLIEQQSKSADYTLVLSDNSKHIYHPAADTTPRTWTIPANASVAYPIGAVITFVNDVGAGAITIAITSDSMWLAGSSSTGSRTLAAGGVATALKVSTTRWVISGAGIS